jgi:predicted amidohydrolase
MTASGESSVRVACLQMEPRIGDKPYNLKRTLEMIGDAAAAGARLLVLPELCNTGYVFETREEAFRLAEELPGGPTTEAWLQTAGRHGLTIVAGITERAGAVLYNSAVVIGPGGYLGRYRKNHLWGAENLFFEPGNLGVPVFPTRSVGSPARSATTSGSRRPFDSPPCREPTSSACRPTGCRCPSSRPRCR